MEVEREEQRRNVWDVPPTVRLVSFSEPPLFVTQGRPRHSFTVSLPRVVGVHSCRVREDERRCGPSRPPESFLLRFRLPHTDLRTTTKTVVRCFLPCHTLSVLRAARRRILSIRWNRSYFYHESEGKIHDKTFWWFEKSFPTT